jgi:hypothetical protein
VIVPAKKKAELSNRKSGRKRLPDFSNMTIAEEAEWWDTHDTAEYEHEFVDDDLVFVPGGRKRPMTIRLEPELVSALTSEAKAKGIGASTLARMLIIEHLRRRPSRPVGRGAKGAA